MSSVLVKFRAILFLETTLESVSVMGREYLGYIECLCGYIETDVIRKGNVVLQQSTVFICVLSTREDNLSLPTHQRNISYTFE